MYFSTTPSALIVCSFLADGYSEWCDLLPLCGWICMCLIIPWNWALRHVLLLFKLWVQLTSSNCFLLYVPHFEMFWCLPASRHFEGSFHLQLCSTCAYEVTISTDFKAAVAGNGQRVAAFLCSPLWYLGKQTFLPVVFLSYKLEWNVPG